MSPLLLVGILLLLLLIRVPVGVALLVPGLLYLLTEPTANLNIAVQQMTTGANSFALLAVPMFILLGNLSNAGSLTDRLFDFASAALGRVRGGLAYVNVITSFGFSWISGAAISDAATMGKIMVPQMVKRGYPPGFALGLTGVSSLIAPMIPPSIPAVVYAVTAGVSVSALFLAGLAPALILTAILCLYVFVIGRRYGGRDELDSVPKQPWPVQLIRVLPTFGAPVVVLGGILGGVMTPTEASAVGVAYVFVLGLLYRTLTWQRIKEALVASAHTTASIMFIVVSAALFGWVLARERVPHNMAVSMQGVTENPFVFMTLLVALLLVVGMFVEPTSAILIMVPVLTPMAEVFGVDPVHMGVVVIFTLMVGLLTPPVGLVLFVLSGVTGYSVSTVVRGTVPFYVVMTVVLLLITYVPLLF